MLDICNRQTNDQIRERSGSEHDNVTLYTHHLKNALSLSNELFFVKLAQLPECSLVVGFQPLLPLSFTLSVDL